MICRTELSLYLNDLLCCNRYNDYAPNGIQVEGKTEIKRICTAVTASEDIINQAVECHADALLVHHGYFWRGEDPVITGMKRQRINALLRHDMNLFAYHLPLDCHPDLGNNACLTKLLSLEAVQMHQVGTSANLLWTGILPNPMTEHQLSHALEHILGRKPLFISGHPRLIQSIALCSGGAQDYIENAHQLGVDAYLSGEVSERTYYQAKELGIDYFACGHHATERYGIQALGAHLAQHFNLTHLFLDSDNPV
ncbi:Nif3-like dinuclear metal center hexameric protein [Legionella worsleiensis]|uniref:Putative NIF3-like protein 1 n=1 Tax=Legionella worsleiensis TaxID=45076 RepID=A0A0W1A3P8_9GAMM|nr:Nif3-like dinuclear metal center hexameric protein [Legionella worsleiensis]KTD75973.1 putative NIF3-like protein 1 [Legionella worsleiensis]STY32986.1 putative NIF3-like protein 1 [Legionella worsleiensis]